jgi:hypothetical protein
LKPLTVENIVFSQGSYSIGPCIDTRTRAEKIAAGCLVEMGNGVEWHCAVGHGCVVVGDQLGLQDSIPTPSGAPLPAKKFDRSYWIPFFTALGASGTDWHSTHGGLARGAREGNPVFGTNGGRGVRWGANVAATGAFLTYTAWLEHKGHRKIARTLLYLLTGLRTAASVWNYTRRR